MYPSVTVTHFAGWSSCLFRLVQQVIDVDTKCLLTSDVKMVKRII